MFNDYNASKVITALRWFLLLLLIINNQLLLNKCLIHLQQQAFKRLAIKFNDCHSDIIGGFIGYPLYFLYIIGVWKILGVMAILIPQFKLVKEWAYAGFFFFDDRGPRFAFGKRR